MTKDRADLNFLLEEGKSRQLTEDEITTLFHLTRKRIQRLEQKAALLYYARRKNPRPEKVKNPIKTSKKKLNLDKLKRNISKWKEEMKKESLKN